MEDILRGFPVVDEDIIEQPVPLVDGGVLDGAIAASPRCGGTLWQGKDCAAEVVDDVVDAADARGRLRAIIDAVRSNRVEDDFSDRWSYAREDFERKLYHKRKKVRVRELPKGKLAVPFLYAAFGAYLIGQVALAFVGLVVPDVRTSQ